jgi:hypothetical protein
VKEKISVLRWWNVSRSLLNIMEDILRIYFKYSFSYNSQI